MAKFREKLPLFSHRIKYGSLQESSSESKKKEENDELSKKSGIYGLFRYATKGDAFLLLIGSLFATIHGASMPALAMVFGQMTNTLILQSFRDSSKDFSSANQIYSILNESDGHKILQSTESESGLTTYMTSFALYYLFIGIGVLIAGFVQTLCWELACERQIYRLREKFFSQLLRQDITWFDQQKGGDLTTKLSDDLERVREGIGSKMSMVLQYVSTFVSGLGVGLYSNLKLTLIILGISPLMIGTSAYMAITASSAAAREQLKYSIAGKIAEEVLTNIRTVVAYGGEDQEVRRYEAGLKEGFRLAIKKYYVLSAGLGAVFFVIYASYGVAFWYGSEMIGSGEATPGSVFTVFFSVMAGAFALGNALPFVNAVSAALGAASTIFDIVDRIPDIDPYCPKGLKPKKIDGRISFRDVTFKYPARPEISVLSNFTLDVEPGKTIALVGSSGAGKSTVVSLLLRHYDPTEGIVMLDGIDIRYLNLDWLRWQIGIVSQEPVLFGVSIHENIRFGRSDVTEEEIIQAAKMANAHEFIIALPMGYNTLVGERGTQLSGGQKQRIAIARALVRDPKILILDEATSALDSQSEGEVRDALDRAAATRTTIVVAHRLSTIKNADVIYAMKSGKIYEKGSHDELMSRKEMYYDLVISQSHENENEDKSEAEGYFSDARSEKSCKSPTDLSPGCSSNPFKSRPEIKIPKVSMFKLLLLNSVEWPWLLMGYCGCILTGSVMPIFAYFYGEVFATFQLSGEELRQAAFFWSMMFLALAVGSGFAYWVQTVGMATAAEKLVLRLRLLAFDNIVRQAVGWFDLEEHSSGRLITRLARDAPIVKAASGLRAGQLISAGVTLSAALSIAFINGWKLALLLVVAAPIIAGASYQQMMILRRNQRRDIQLMDSAGRVASESVGNIKTVRSLGLEKLFLDLYMRYLAEPFKEAKKQAFIYAAVFGFSQAVIFMMYAGAFRFGAYLIDINEMTATEVYRVFFALAFCAASVGQTSAYLQDYTKAKLAGEILFQLIYTKTEIDAGPSYGFKPMLKGKISFKNVHFRYPSRPDVEILKGVNLEVEHGKTLALVGASGGGKSTFVALLQRFYDPESGTVCVDDIDIRLMNLGYLRGCMGLVTQEPVLFDSTIKENIAYGAENVDMNDIISAAKNANIHEFIVNLPQGYDTRVGERGTQLSGGQKQRIAIARALIRNPKILLLDEATSALDAENERVVQEALDKARKGRTCIIIAHRLSTIENADEIAVLQNGIIIEKGTHSHLKNKHGVYYNLIKRQRI